METKIEKLSELSKLLNVKTRMSDDLFHLFGKFGIGHLLLEKQDGGLGFGFNPFSLPLPHCGREHPPYMQTFFLCSFLLEEPVSRLLYLPIVYSV